MSISNADVARSNWRVWLTLGWDLRSSEPNVASCSKHLARGSRHGLIAAIHLRGVLVRFEVGFQEASDAGHVAHLTPVRR